MANTSFKIGRFIVGILFLILAFFSFKNPLVDLLAIAILFGITALSNGIILILQKRNTPGIILGILNIIIGGVFLFNIGLSIMLVPYMFAFWFIVNSVSNLAALGSMQEVGKNFYWFSLIFNIIGILLGASLLFDPITSVLTITFLIGIYFIIAGVDLIVLAFVGTNKNNS